MSQWAWCSLQCMLHHLCLYYTKFLTSDMHSACMRLCFLDCTPIATWRLLQAWYIWVKIDRQKYREEALFCKTIVITKPPIDIPTHTVHWVLTNMLQINVCYQSHCQARLMFVILEIDNFWTASKKNVNFRKFTACLWEGLVHKWSRYKC